MSRRVRWRYSVQRRQHPTKTRRGIALIFVLWTLVMLGLAVGALVARVRAEALRVAALKARVVAQYAAESGVLATTVALQTMLDSAAGPADVAAEMRHLDTLGRVAPRLLSGDAQCAVAVLDLNARLDLAHSDTSALQGLFAQFVSAGRASTIVRGLQDAPVTRLPELARVPGADDAVALAVAPYVTVGSDGFVNVNTASEPVLAAIPGIGSAKAAAIIAQRESGPLTSIDAFRPAPGAGPPAAAEGMRLTITPTRLLIVSRGWQRGSPGTHEIQAVYVMLAGRLSLQSWEERER